MSNKKFEKENPIFYVQNKDNFFKHAVMTFSNTLRLLLQFVHNGHPHASKKSMMSISFTHPMPQVD